MLKDPLANPFLLFVPLLLVLCGGEALANAKSKTPGAPNTSKTLTVNDYLDQVKERHLGYKGSTQLSHAILGKSNEAKLATQPALFGSATVSEDKKQTSNPPAQGTRTDYKNAQFGVSQSTDFGLQGKVYYDISTVKMHDTQSMYVPEPSTVDMRPKIEVSQALWRNAFGRELQSQQEAADTAVKAQSLGERFRQRAILTEAEISYWRLSAARDTLGIQSESLDRARRLRDWSQQRHNKQLTDDSDLLSAEAALAARQFELDAAQGEERTAAYALNSLRGTEVDAVDESLARVLDFFRNGAGTSDAFSPNPPRRLDVMAMEAEIKTAELGEGLSHEKYLPTLEGFGQFALNGHDEQASKAMRESFTTQYPSVVLGLRFNTLLGGERLAAYEFALREEIAAKKLNLERKRYEVEREWRDLLRKYDDSRKRLDLAKKVETAQRLRLDAEKDRHERGRSTMFQVLMAEGDYSLAQLNSLHTAADLHRIKAQMHLFGED